MVLLQLPEPCEGFRNSQRIVTIPSLAPESAARGPGSAVLLLLKFNTVPVALSRVQVPI